MDQGQIRKNVSSTWGIKGSLLRGMGAVKKWEYMLPPTFGKPPPTDWLPKAVKPRRLIFKNKHEYCYCYYYCCFFFHNVKYCGYISSSPYVAISTSLCTNRHKNTSQISNLCHPVYSAHHHNCFLLMSTCSFVSPFFTSSFFDVFLSLSSMSNVLSHTFITPKQREK